MKTNFTPGPWTIQGRAKGLAINGPRSTVCNIGFLDDQGMADAELIAAAPDMFAALLNLVAMLPSQAPESVGHSFLIEAQAAIAKATGSAR